MSRIGSGAAVFACLALLGAFAGTGPERLYNGIVLPAEWPPRDVVARTWDPDRIPYLEKGNIPAVIPIDVGRQLFVDDFLIERTDLARIYPKPVKYAGNPVLWPETAREKSEGGLYPVALPKGGGLWWDPERKVFRLWYEASWIGHICYAESKDGIRFERVNTDVEPGGNCVLPQQHVDSWSVVPDPECADPAQRWKLFVHPGCSANRTLLYVSADGIHWTGPKLSGAADDRSTMFYNPFRRKWCFSLRSCWRGRSKNYAEFDDFLSSDWQWPWDGVSKRVYTNTEHCVLWMAADRLDRQTSDPNLNEQASLYSMDAVAYESIMLGAAEIHWGPENDVCGERGLPKITDIQFAYSRDGFHFSRPDRAAAIPSSRWGSDAWDTGYVQPLSNLCVVQGDELWFYYGAFRGMKDHPKKRGLYANGATGFAKLRRDGFVGMKAAGRGELLTRPVTFSGNRLFVNADCPKGALRVEVQGADGKPLRGFALADCRPVAVDSTKVAVRWKGGDRLPSAKTPFRFRFELKDGVLYSFWVSPSARGESNGYLAGGGPGYRGLVDK